jgi:transmembrane sensor
MPTGANPMASIDPAIVRRASEWMARLWSGEASDADEAACAQWRGAHPDHALAWDRLQVMEEKLHAVPRQVARRVLHEPAAPTYLTRRGVLRSLGLTVTIAGLASLARETDAWRVALSDHSTQVGEIREITLPDGTRVLLNTASSIDVQFDQVARRIVLRAGEILVTTAHDPAAAHRPFRVQTRQGLVEALGTRFSVRQDSDSSRVAVFEGMVELQPTGSPGAAVRLAAGQGADFAVGRATAPVAVREDMVGWQKGVLVAENMRVADFLAELGRYRTGLLRCDPAAAELRVSGVFSLRDTDQALLNLTLGLPVRLVYRTRYWVTVQAS